MNSHTHKKQHKNAISFHGWLNVSCTQQFNTNESNVKTILLHKVCCNMKTFPLNFTLNLKCNPFLKKKSNVYYKMYNIEYLNILSQLIDHRPEKQNTTGVFHKAMFRDLQSNTGLY